MEENAPPPPKRSWKGAAVRIGIAAALVVAVTRIGGEETWSRLSDPRVLPAVLLGAFLHLGQRLTRIYKWAPMVRDSGLKHTSFVPLLRIQLASLLANVIFPVSEGIKIAAVSRNREDAVLASASIVADTAMHGAAMVGVGLVGCALVGGIPGWMWGTYLGFGVLAVVVVLAVRFWRRPARLQTLRFVDARIGLGLAGETFFQIAIYGVALHTIGIDVTPVRLAAIGALLFLGDVILITPSGVGIREALFAGVLEILGDAPSGAGVAAGLVTSSILFVGSLIGGLIGVAWTKR